MNKNNKESESGQYIDIHPSRKRFIVEYIVSILLLIAVGYLIFFPLKLPWKVPYIDLELLIVSLLASNSVLLLLYVELRRSVERYSITEGGVTEETGFFDRHSTNIPLRMMERTEIEEDILQRALNLGDIIIDTGEDYFVMRGIPDPGEKVTYIDSYLDELRNQY